MIGQHLVELSGWGRCPVVEGRELVAEDLAAVCEQAVLSRGLGRSYGDASLPPSLPDPVLGTRLADRLLAFDAEHGVLRAEAGLALDELQALLLPRGWTCPVLPGTGRVTLGGMLAADVHGKNHLVAGCIGAHVRGLRLAVADGRVLEIGPAVEPALFAATLGGLGLTGHILEVELQLERVPSTAILAESEAAASLDGVLVALRRASAAWPFATAWVDGLADAGRSLRGVVHKGRWAAGDELPGHALRRPRRLSVPRHSPRLVGRRTVGLFNAWLYRRHARAPRGQVVHPDGFFHPLDNVVGWNRLYGGRGLVQHQCVLPDEAGDASLRRLFATLAASRVRSTLCVLKTCGAQGGGMLSFPMAGITVALDLPMQGAVTQDAVDALNQVVIEAGGRVYLAKDALTRPEHLAAMDAARLAAFQSLRRQWDPGQRFRSALSVRLLGDTR